MSKTIDDSPVQVSDEEVIAQQVFAISRLTPAMMAANVLNVFSILAVLTISEELSYSASIWALATLSFACYLLFKWYQHRGRPFPSRMDRRLKKRLVMMSMILGCLWAYPGLVILPDVSYLTQAFLITMAAGMISGGAISLYPVPLAALSFSGLIAAGHLIGFALTGGPIFICFMLATIVFFWVIANSVMRHEQIFVSEFRNRLALIEKNTLVAKLLDESRSEVVAQKRESDAKFAQVQKLEAVGRLTAGVAHDFNNLLAIIMGNVEMALCKSTDGKVQEMLNSALESTKRGSDLTRQLLAFGRQAPLLPEYADPSVLIRGMDSLLRRTLPAVIRIDTCLAENIGAIEVDRAQFESALLNLAINARDAMPAGGVLTITTNRLVLDRQYCDTHGTNLVPGPYVLVTVADTGVGVLTEHLDQVFEPFFTTKAVNEGSGLGLAMVYGFAQQSGGNAEIFSKPGNGTTVKLFFPEVSDVTPTGISESPDVVGRTSGTERILVVEDTDEVRIVVVNQLKSFGFDVLQAGDGESALAILHETSDIDLLLTDIVMPGDLQGPALAGVAREKWPDMKIIFTSGYPDGASERSGSETRDILKLTKPIQMNELAHTLLRVLDVELGSG